MNLQNETEITEFILIGFPNTRQMEIFLFFVFAAMYIWTVTANFVIIILVRLDNHLHTPMYFFISNLSALEIWYTTVTTPKLLANFLLRSNLISLQGCLIQFYMFFSLGSTQCLLLGVMAFDRYFAICNPLRYNVIITNKACTWAASGSWGTGFLSMLLPGCMVFKLSFCCSNVINHFFCDADPLLKLSCTETRLIELVNFMLAVIIVLSSFLLTLVSYIYIITTVMRIPSATGRHKAFSTCTSHLTIVIIFYTTVIFMYVRPRVRYSDLSKVVSVLYSVVTPVLNPIIYTLRNKNVKHSIHKILRWHIAR